MVPCPFCTIQEKDNSIVLRNDYCLFLQKPQKILIGSGIIIPIEHRETVFDLTKEEWLATFDLLHDVKRYMNKRYKPDGYTVGWNVHAIGGQEIFHAHLHVIPRFSDEPLAGKGIRHWLKQDTNKRTKIPSYTY